MSLPKIIDNDRKSLFSVIDSLAPEHTQLSIATGYWDLPGTALIIDKLLGYDTIRLLIGREPLINRHQLSEPEPDFPDIDIFRDLENTLIDPKLSEAVTKIKELIASEKLEVKIYRGGFLHAKCYIFGGYDSDQAVGIIGSSNFTKAGLTKNTELNALESDHRIVTFQPQNDTQETGHLAWFDRFWNDEKSEIWNGKFLEILSQSPIGDELFTPYEMYIKTLYEMYKDELNTSVFSTDQDGYTLMPYQARNIGNLIRKLDRNKVAMLADSVGLGKTLSAIEVIKQYRNPTDKNKGRRVEVIVPSSLERQWHKEMAKFGLADDYIPVTPFHNQNRLEERQEYDRYAPVNLFVIDESHNLRNTNSRRYEWVYKWIEKNPDAHVLLLTATPINNQMNDLTSQILLAAKGNPNIAQVVYETADKKGIKIENFEVALKDIQSSIKRSMKQKQDVLQNYERLKRVVREVIGKFIVRNTRQGVKKDPDFQGAFPHAIPQNANYSFSTDLTQGVVDVATKNLDDAETLLWFDTVAFTSPERVKTANHPLDQLDGVPQLPSKDISTLSPVFFIYQLILLLGFLPYRWKMYEEKFYGKTYEDIFGLKLADKEQLQILSQLSIYGMLRVSYLKRLESSVYAIRESISRYGKLLGYLKESIINKNEIVSFKKLDVTLDYLNGDSLDDDAMELVNVYEIPAGFKKDELLHDIDRDINLVTVILSQLDILQQDDSKIKALAETINHISTNNINNGKVLLFSFFSDTIDYLKDNLPALCPMMNEHNAAFGSGKNKQEVGNYADRFAPDAKGYDLKEGETEIQFLFATDVLSEGQNLQDCGVIINYDLHWNPVRMIQRNGRINRLGSKFSEIYIYNMFPEQQLDHYLGLVQRLESKLDMINFCIGLDQPVLNDEFEAVEFVDDIKQLYTNPSEGLIDSLEARTDLLSTEDGFLQDLKEFDESADADHKDKIYNRIPFGKWGAQPALQLQASMKKRPEVLLSSKLYTQDATGQLKDTDFVMFATVDKKGQMYKRIEPLIALQLLKCAVDTQGLIDAKGIDLHVDRISIAQSTVQQLQEKHEYQANRTEGRVLTPTQQIFVESLIGSGYEETVRLPIRNAFMYLTNSIRLAEFTKLYNAAKKDIHNLEAVRKLADYANESLEIHTSQADNDDGSTIIKPMLYHVGFTQ